METKEISKDDEISILESVLDVLKATFEHYAYQLSQKHDVWLDEYDLVDFSLLIKQKKREKEGYNNGSKKD